MRRRLPRAVLLAALALLGACSTSAPPAPVPLRLKLEHRLGAAPLQLGQATKIADGSEVTLNRLAYYLGGLRVQDAQGRWIASARASEPAGDYALIDAAKPGSLVVEGPALAPGRYTALELRIGLDAAHNGGGAQAGALDPALGMYWTWKTGYIFFDLEGRSSASGDANQAITWHLGGDAEVARTLVLPLQDFEIRPGAPATLRLQAHLDELLGAVNLAEQHTAMDSACSGPIADAYAPIFRLAPAAAQAARAATP